jgi:hypothetical protein
MAINRFNAGDIQQAIDDSEGEFIAFLEMKLTELSAIVGPGELEVTFFIEPMPDEDEDDEGPLLNKDSK